jgi:hypothetical protein
MNMAAPPRVSEARSEQFRNTQQQWVSPLRCMEDGAASRSNGCSLTALLKAGSLVHVRSETLAVSLADEVRTP